MTKLNEKLVAMKVKNKGGRSVHFEKESNLINHWIISSFRLNAMAKSSDDFEMTPK